MWQGESAFAADERGALAVKHSTNVEDAGKMPELQGYTDQSRKTTQQPSH